MSNNAVIAGLRKVLADTFVLYFKTHSFHWNVEGPRFKSLHDMFGEQYNELWLATDEIAERIRSLGEYAPKNWEDAVATATLTEAPSLPAAADMVQQLAADHAALAQAIKPSLKAAQEAEDEVTADLLIGRMTVHEKTAWMLKSLAKG